MFQFQISQTHNVYLSQRIQTEFKEGQRVFVWGKLQANSFRVTDDKPLTRAIVKAQGVYIIDDPNPNNETSSSSSSDESSGEGGDNESIKDQNHVQILANVASDILNKDNHSTFALATHANYT